MKTATKTISGAEAIERMRRLKLIPNAKFGMVFYTCDLSRHEHGDVRRYELCRLRAARRDEGLNVSTDHYLFFEDTETGEPRQCFKKLIRKVCFPPSNEWLDVKWFDN